MDRDTNEAEQGLYAYSLETIRGLLLLNGGAVVAILTFVGHLVAAEDDRAAAVGTATAQGIVWPVSLFAVGALLAAATAGLSYLSQTAYVQWLDDRNDAKAAKINTNWRNAALCTGVLSGAAFAIGGIWTAIILSNATA